MRRGRFPQALVTFVELFERGEYWDSHEVLEDPWRAGRSGFYKGLILLASAWVHVGRGNPRGIGAQLRKALRELSPYRPAYLGVDVEALCRHAERMLVVLAENRGSPPGAWAVLVPPPRLDLDPARVRGDEPEARAGSPG